MSFIISLLALYVFHFIILRFEGSQYENPSIGLFSTSIFSALVFSATDVVIYSIKENSFDSGIFEFYVSYFGNFALQCLLISLVIFKLLRKLLDHDGHFILAAISGVLAYLLNTAGFTQAFSNFFDTGLYAFEEFLSRLLSISDYVAEDWFIRGLLIYPISVTIFLSISFRSTIQKKKSIKSKSYIGGHAVAFNNSSNEPFRLAAGLAAVGRLPGQSSLEDEIAHPVQAAPYPVDFDRNAIVEIVKNRNDQKFARSMLYSVFALFGVLVTAGTESPVGILVAALASIILYFRTLQNDKYNIAADYKPDAFELSPLHTKTFQNQNLVVYAGNSPFSNFGSVFGNWILSVDKGRAKPGLDLSGKQYKVQKADIKVIRDAICASLKGSGIEDEDIRTLYFTQGKNIPSQIKSSGPSKPPQNIQITSIGDLIAKPDAPVREYLWIRKAAWSKEVSTSYFLRIVEVRDDINLEITAVLMPPISEAHRWIDKIPPRRLRQMMGDLFISIFGGVALLIWSPIYLAGLFQIGFAKMFTDPEKAMRRSVEQQPDYDFGAPLGLRRRMSDFGAISYFQNSDRQMAESAFTGRILRSFIDALDAYCIDTSELREQRTTLLNQGIIVQGGDLNAKNVSSGLGARINNVTSKISGSTKGATSE